MRPLCSGLEHLQVGLTGFVKILSFRRFIVVVVVVSASLNAADSRMDIGHGGREVNGRAAP
jgi:hypothetical protein